MECKDYSSHPFIIESFFFFFFLLFLLFIVLPTLFSLRWVLPCRPLLFSLLHLLLRTVLLRFTSYSNRNFSQISISYFFWVLRGVVKEDTSFRNYTNHVHSEKGSKESLDRGVIICVPCLDSTATGKGPRLPRTTSLVSHL